MRGRSTSVLPARTARIVVALTAAVALTVAPGASGVSSADPTPPPNPTDQQLSGAAAQKAALASQVGQLSSQVASLETQVSQLRSRAEFAEQKLADALTKLAESKQAAVVAQAAVVTAAANVKSAQAAFDQFIHDSYVNGTVGGLTGSLLTAEDPSSLLQRSDYENYIAANQLDAIGRLNRATVGQSNADAQARLAVQTQAQLTAAADTARQQAEQALQAAKDAQARLADQLASTRTALSTAQAQLADLNGQRATYNAYVAEQARIAAAKAAALLAAQQAAARLAAQAQARAQAQGQGQGQSQNRNSGGGYSTPAPVNIAPTGGGWSADKAATAVARARQYLGWPYSYAAGNSNGPTYGVAVDSDSRNDGSVYGFDCSGLTMYAWGPYLGMDHFAATQYSQVGNFHPSVDQLLPGDLVFWSDNGSIGGIGHVAIYIGGGNVIQAPYSGAYIEVTPLDQVEDGYYGATRPLT